MIKEAVRTGFGDYPLCIFYHGHDVYDDDDENLDDNDEDDDFYNNMMDNIEYIFSYIIDKYFQKDRGLMMNAFYQSLNSLIYFMKSKNESSMKQILIYKFMKYIKIHFH